MPATGSWAARWGGAGCEDQRRRSVLCDGRVRVRLHRRSLRYGDAQSLADVGPGAAQPTGSRRHAQPNLGVSNDHVTCEAARLGASECGPGREPCWEKVWQLLTDGLGHVPALDERDAVSLARGRPRTSARELGVAFFKRLVLALPPPARAEHLLCNCQVGRTQPPRPGLSRAAHTQLAAGCRATRASGGDSHCSHLARAVPLLPG